MAAVLARLGLTESRRRPAVCPACLRMPVFGEERLSAPAVFTLAGVLVVSILAWVFVAGQTSMGMAVDMMAWQVFAGTWVLMMAAMMLPSAVPVVVTFARKFSRRQGWPAATAILGVSYMCVWLAFGIACYALYMAVGMPWPQQTLIGGALLVAAGLYSLTPLKRSSQARCRELCALHGPLPFNLYRSGALVGFKYGLSCLGCSGALMIAMVVIGMASLGWALVLAAIVLVYKFAPALPMRQEILVSLAVVAAGIVYEGLG
jgi:predicted metal-binding membrane protein